MASQKELETIELTASELENTVVEKGAKVRVPALSDEVGASVDLEVLAATDGDQTKVGTPLVDGAMVKATVLDHGREPKIVVFKKKL